MLNICLKSVLWFWCVFQISIFSIDFCFYLCYFTVITLWMNTLKSLRYSHCSMQFWGQPYLSRIPRHLLVYQVLATKPSAAWQEKYLSCIPPPRDQLACQGSYLWSFPLGDSQECWLCQLVGVVYLHQRSGCVVKAKKKKKLCWWKKQIQATYL